MYTVYMHKCPNGKVYIGITGQTVKERWKGNGQGYHGNKHFFQAIKKYGWDNIEHIIIKSKISKHEACELEKTLIAQYQSNNREYGYNKSTGGESPAQGFHHSESTKAVFSQMRKGVKFSDEHKQKISEALKGRSVSDETKEKLRQNRLGTRASAELREHLSKTRTGILNPRYGVRLSEETKAKISKATKGKIISAEQRKLIGEKSKKPIRCVETGVIFPSIKEAGEAIGTDPTNIVNTLAGRQKTTKGLHFEYINPRKPLCMERGDADG
jgi:group I intron endonuclease